MTTNNGFDSLHSRPAPEGRKHSQPARRRTRPRAGPGLRVGPLYVNARQKYDAAALQALLALAAERDVGGAITRLFRGEQVNLTEGRAAAHTALRGDVVDAPVAAEAYATARGIRQRMGVLVRALEDSGVTDVVSVGIGDPTSGRAWSPMRCARSAVRACACISCRTWTAPPCSARWPRWIRRRPPAS